MLGGVLDAIHHIHPVGDAPLADPLGHDGRGLDQRLITAANQLSYGDTFAIVFILALIALTMNGGIGFAERKALRWQATQQGGQVISL